MPDNSAWYLVSNPWAEPVRRPVLDLQRFASAEAEGRTEKATEHKKRKAREEEGRVALSKEVPGALISLLSFSAIYFLGNYIITTFMQTFEYIFQNLTTLDITDGTMFVELFVIPVAKIFLPVSAIAFITAILGNYLQIGIKFSVKTIKPNFKKINPNVIKFLTNQVFAPQGLFNLVKSVVKIGIIGLAAFIAIRGNLGEIKGLIFNENLFYSFVFFTKIAFGIVLKATIVLLVFSIIDIIFVRWQFEESLKMKKQEVKEEVKELYGDPNVRARLRQMYQSIMSQKKMLGEVPASDVVITNPTHYAIALRYDSAVDDAPRVLAKGKDKFALQIMEVAREHDIYIYRNVPLARSLYSDVEVNDIIPREMYSLVIHAYKLANAGRNAATAAAG
jgi:flagellar biosynthetic protein FlhB